ncbi:MAG: hypothetical protein IJS15_16950 [Victivallales bacterium]|nr:hypothetical protein [Victivallales bacterium]
MADATERLFVDSGTGTINKNYKNFTLENAAIPDLWDDGDNVGGAAIFVTGAALSSANTGKFTFSNNSNLVTDSDFGGGAILLFQSKINAYNLTFTDNSSVNNGGAISIKSSEANKPSTLTGATFTGNTASGKGGAIYMDGKGTLTLDACKFTTATDTIYLGDAQATLIFKGETEIAASVTGNNNTKTKIDGAEIAFNNTEEINVLKLNVVGTANKMTFGGKKVNFTDQDLSAVSIGAYNHSEENAKDVVATGVKAISDETKDAYDLKADKKNVEFFFLDGTDLTHYRTDTLTVVYGKDATGAGEFASTADLYGKVGDDFAGILGTEIAAGYEFEGTLRGTNKYTDGVALNIAGDVTGSAIAILANAKVFDDQFSSASVNVSGSVDGYVIGGAFAKNAGVANIADTAVVLAGTLNDDVFGGSWVSGDADNASASTVDKAVVEINEGANQTEGYVFGGGMASGKDVSSVVTSSEITVNADFDSVVFAGGWSQKEGKAEVGDAVIDLKAGTVGTVFAGGTNQAGSVSAVTGAVTINLDGGTADAIYLNGKYSGSVVEGDVTLEVKQNAYVSLIEGLTSTATAASADTNTTINVAAVLLVDEISHVDNWNIAEGGEINFNADLDFEQKIQGKKAFGPINLNINDESIDADGREVLTTNGEIFSFNADFVNVTLNDQAAIFDAEANAFISDSYTLSIVDDSKLVFARMAVGRW